MEPLHAWPAAEHLARAAAVRRCTRVLYSILLWEGVWSEALEYQHLALQRALVQAQTLELPL